jgi:hypothetical protein
VDECKPLPPIFIWNAPASTVHARYRTNTGEVPTMVYRRKLNSKAKLKQN